MAKRVRSPAIPKPGVLKAQWGSVDGSGPDVCYAWGEGVSGADARFLSTVLCGERLRLAFPSMETVAEKSFIEEMEARGYDITTLKFSIQKKEKGQ